jgi:hypothetical protein
MAIDLNPVALTQLPNRHHNPDLSPEPLISNIPVFLASLLGIFASGIHETMKDDF